MLKNSNLPNGRHKIKGRKVQFDFTDTPLYWLKDDPFSTHLINGIHLLLPAGELFFCRVYNQALPLVTDNDLREDVEGFIRQEAIHSRQHTKAQTYLDRNGFTYDEYVSRVNWLFEKFLGNAPFGISYLENRFTKDLWLAARVGVIAAIEHFTGVLGQWAMDNESWERNGDATMVDLFKWHLAEEVEHRTVAYDLFKHLCKTRLGFYASRQALMAIVFPLFIYFIADGFRVLARQDENEQMKKLSKTNIVRLLVELERVGKRTHNAPTFSFLVKATMRWINPFFHPIHEGDTQQALDYLARSPAAIAAEAA